MGTLGLEVQKHCPPRESGERKRNCRRAQSKRQSANAAIRFRGLAKLDPAASLARPAPLIPRLSNVIHRFHIARGALDQFGEGDVGEHIALGHCGIAP